MRKRAMFRIYVVSLAILLVLAVILFLVTGNIKDIGAIKTYKADVKVLRLNTEIVISDNDDNYLFTIKGKILKILTDPLILYDKNDNAIAYAGDEYKIITQDTHWITDYEGNVIKMVGHFNLFGDSYDIFIGDQKVAYAEFNVFNTYGTIVDNDGNLMADYTSKIIFNDYTVQATKYNIFSDEVLNLIIASYYSDQKADNSTNSGSRSSHD